MTWCTLLTLERDKHRFAGYSMIHTTQSRKVPQFWVDCDPGHDDAFALLLAHNASRLVACSTTHGNASLERTTQNASSVLRSIGADHVPLYQGAAKPLHGECHVAQEIHGKSGLDGTNLLPAPDKALVQSTSIEGMLSSLSALTTIPDAKMTLCATGPVTNIALITKQSPYLLEQRFEKLIIMGGALKTGNWTSQAEFNVWADPHALQQVLDAPCWDGKRVIIPLEVTHQLLLTDQVLQRMRDGCNHSSFARMWEELGTFFNKTYKEVFNFEHGPVHDPATVAFALNPELFTGRYLHVEVDTREGPTKGRTIVDVWGQTGNPPNAFVCEGVAPGGVDKFWTMITEAMISANRESIVNKDQEVAT
ncbi:Inosine/uridine-preferring nucleoside hydrolase domain-containing protein [Protomyces lactucae-debilis]|uniref:Inosine/uridine-preferring nucleoside hydrolase domain-containing protein n=1 Tax=Protomyces lactucae-debilis TaxID=2754530 RepID=A0A1Y2FC15_PROLT|nr:Inosine/uridine-preferring nucleoside hydrolase domain-containing protein [Protomyces lactucae-debilis]ORY81441.1 Inosine/uridine-preferring nucleoside hydrolase domain-containing protein [Protomyces lactucae-debilis]